MKKALWIVWCCLVLLALPVFAACPTADLTGDCRVDLADFAVIAEQWLTAYDSDDLAAMTFEWLTEGNLEPDITWVLITEPEFSGQMSKYETTNAQYCQFLNAALASGDVTVCGDYVCGADGSNSGADFVGQAYYYLIGNGTYYNEATRGGASRIHYTDNSFTVDGGFENHPVTYVSWDGSTAFCNYYGWRLPTEWEWQGVADYDGSYTYGCGAVITNLMANYYDSVHLDGTREVGSFGAFGYGMCDMAGNVYEWTSSLYTPTSSERELRGGSWHYSSGYSAISYRYNYRVPSYKSYGIGFRVCR
jgi:formylglycine-generating enzyme required for sulfatase activity